MILVKLILTHPIFRNGNYATCVKCINFNYYALCRQEVTLYGSEDIVTNEKCSLFCWSNWNSNWVKMVEWSRKFYHQLALRQAYQQQRSVRQTVNFCFGHELTRLDGVQQRTVVFSQHSADWADSVAQTIHDMAIEIAQETAFAENWLIVN